MAYRSHRVASRSTLLDTGACTADNEWIFVLSAADQVLYAHRKVSERILFHLNPSPLWLLSRF